jgi:effector-binding domain-containing protein
MAIAPSTEPKMIELEAGPTVAVRIHLPMAELDLAEQFKRWTPALNRYVEEHGLERTGPVYGRYFEFGRDRVDVEIGIPLAASPNGLDPVGPDRLGDIGASQLPGGTAAAVTHVGPYNGLGQEYDRLHDCIHAHGRDEGVGPWESYTDDIMLVADHSTLRTEIVWPLG